MKRTTVTPALPDQTRPDQTKKKKKNARARASPDPEPAPDGLDRAAWERWAAYRSSIGKPLKAASIAAAMRALAKHGPNQAAVVEQSVANGWQGLFELKTSNGAGNGAHQQARGPRPSAVERIYAATEDLINGGPDPGGEGLARDG